MEKISVKELPIANISIKKEQINDEIKEFAETAMNELLGWYGYGGSRDEATTSKPNISRSRSNSSDSKSPSFSEGCGWCGKQVSENSRIFSSSTVFCSELCFSQSRRANFKKNKTCDWCRHVRNTVTYIESQDGGSQLQFCTDKCLNQYKMHIFCKETRAHLEIHPHIHVHEKNNGTLITPELWMKNCKSHDGDSTSTNLSLNLQEKHIQDSSPSLITVAPPSKLMKLPSEHLETKKPRTKLTRKNKRKSFTSTASSSPYNTALSNDTPQDLRVRHTADFDTHTNVEQKGIINDAVPARDVPNAKDNYFLNTILFNKAFGKIMEKPLENILPPPTVMIPYPIILPLPIPVPIPIPLPGLIKEDKTKVQTEEKSSQTNEPINGISYLNTNGVEVEEIPVRPLRKRKRLYVTKPKTIIKSKKSVST